MPKNSLRQGFEIFLSELLQEKISDAEFCAALLVYHREKFQNKKLFSELSTPSTIIQSLNERHWIGFSDRIRRSLIQWHLGHYPLESLDYVPTPFEILNFQAQGKRVVTVFKKISQWESTWGAHDAWNFIAHDLIHADHFFEKPELRQGQIEFYQFVLKNWQHPEIQFLHTQPSFEYLISDMNSHPIHLFETFKNCIVLSRKIRSGISPQERLQDSDENEIQSYFLNWKEELKSAKGIF